MQTILPHNKLIICRGIEVSSSLQLENMKKILTSFNGKSKILMNNSNPFYFREGSHRSLVQTPSQAAITKLNLKTHFFAYLIKFLTKSRKKEIKTKLPSKATQKYVGPPLMHKIKTHNKGGERS